MIMPDSIGSASSSDNNMAGMAASAEPILGIKFSRNARNPQSTAKGTSINTRPSQMRKPVSKLTSVLVAI